MSRFSFSEERSLQADDIRSTCTVDANYFVLIELRGDRFFFSCHAEDDTVPMAL